MNKYSYLLVFVLCFYFTRSEQPYFPSQIVFTPDNGQTVLAIDEPNQRAYSRLLYGATGQEISYVMKNFPYAIPDSPESKNYVQLLTDSPPLGCMYGTYWKYGGNSFNSFPSHWWTDRTSFEVKNYLKFKFDMIRSTNTSEEVDRWYSNVTCTTDSGYTAPCEQILFKKNTDVPIQMLRIVRRGWDVVLEGINFEILSLGKPDDKYFEPVPKNWSVACRDVNLGLYYYPQTSKIDLKKSAQVQVWLPEPPHRINGNDTVTIQWKASNCSDCFTISPKELNFNIDNFQERQILTITRLKDSSSTTLIPNFNGGGFDNVPSVIYPIFID